MRVIIFGASGMVGKGVLLECLKDPGVDSILVVGRSACGVTHDKVTEILHPDLFDLSDLRDRLAGLDACFFCLGVSSAGLSEAEYDRVTYQLTVSVAETLAALNPELTFCFVSGAATDSSESGRIMWARVKGKTENHLLRMPFRAAYMFRPGFIQPMGGIRSKTRMYNVFYAVTGPLYPLLKRVFPRLVTSTDRVGQAMIRVVRESAEKTHLENADINALAAGGPAAASE